MATLPNYEDFPYFPPTPPHNSPFQPNVPPASPPKVAPPQPPVIIPPPLPPPHIVPSPPPPHVVPSPPSQPPPPLPPPHIVPSPPPPHVVPSPSPQPPPPHVVPSPSPQPPPHIVPSPSPPHDIPPPPPHIVPSPSPPHHIPPPPPHIVPSPPHPITPPPPPPTPGHHTVIIFIFVSLGGLFFLAFLSVALFCFLKKRKKRIIQETDKVKIDEHIKVHEDIVIGPHGTKAVVLTIDDDVNIEEVIKKNEVVGKSSHMRSDENHPRAPEMVATTSDHTHNNN
ncbi:putative leucine-rich repeat extensin-like protein 3 [Abeliophyllum distichum]|uniref:Leucine-rich repeat extensin-like protein 3 n=1 Tax=Abeliophyllum distichum TaxID=126358 RepID=A0ABD1QK00_9LAMI